MTATARTSMAPAPAPPLDVFRARCAARASLVCSADLDLQTAVDELQTAAERAHLVEKIGQDGVQGIMAAAFAIVPLAGDLETAFAELTGVLESMPKRRCDGAAPTTVEALIYSLREEGEPALAEAGTLRRLAELSTAQVGEAIARLIRLRPNYPTTVTDELLIKLDGQCP